MRHLRRAAGNGEEVRMARSRWRRALLRYAWLWFVVGMALVVALPPRPASAQNLRCTLGPLGLYWVRTRMVAVEGHQLELRFCAPHEHSIVAEQMLDLAARALPVLDSLTDVRLDGSHQRTFFLENTQKLMELGADGFIDSRNDAITLHPRSLESTLIHELAHYWADRQRFPERWMVEAYAEYLTSLAAGEMGVPFASLPPNGACEGLPLQSWQPGSGPAEVCAYAIGPQVLHDLAAAAGADTLRRVIGDLSRQPGGVRSEALLTRLERESGANLSPLMRGRVFGPELDARLSERAALRERLIQATRAAAAAGIALPPAVDEHLNAWRHQEAAAALEWIEPVLHEVGVTWSRCVELQLDCAALWRGLPPDPGRWAALRERLRDAPQILSVYGDLRAAAQELGVAIPAAFSEEAARLNFATLPALQVAQETLALARSATERCASVQAPCPAAWRQFWNAGDVPAARGALDALNSLLDAAAQLEPRCESLGSQCSLLWRQALEREGPEAAKSILDHLANLLDTYAQLEPGCERLGLPCAAVARQAVDQRGLEAAQQALDDLRDVLDMDTRLEPDCKRLGLQCGAVWRQALEREGPEAAKTALAGLEDMLERGQALEERCGDLGAQCASLWRQTFNQRGVAAGPQALGELETLLDDAVRIEQACARDGWPCAKAWRERFANADLRGAREVLSAQEQALPVLVGIERSLAPSVFDRLPAPGAPAGASPGAALLPEAKQLFAAGEVARAQELVNQAKIERERRVRLWLISVALLLVVLMAGLGALVLLRLRQRATGRRKGTR